MDFMLLNKSDQAIVDFDVRSEIVSKDKFFERAKRYISTDSETLLYRQSLFSDILKISGLSDFLKTLSEKLTEYEPLMKYSQAANNEEKLHSILYKACNFVDCLFEVEERRRACIALIAHHYGCPLAVAHCTCSRVCQAVDIYLLRTKLEEVVIRLFHPLLAFLASTLFDWLNHLDSPRFCKR